MSALRQVLVIDDETERLEQLAALLRGELPDVEVVTWVPTNSEAPYARFEALVASPTGLIVTDHDLTKSGTGLFGSTITGWAQERFLPVCNFSRKPPRSLPRESNFFELRVPVVVEEASRAQYVARVYHGFSHLREHIAANHEERASPAALLAGAMGDLALQDELAPYITSVSSASSAFLKDVRDRGEVPSGEVQVELQTFILGHVLVNAVLEYPGPVMSRAALAAYCALGREAEAALVELFSEAVYSGPFALPGEYFLRAKVDEKIDELASAQAVDGGGDYPGVEVDEYTRAVVTRALDDAPAHGCERCGGVRGGYWCPFKQRPVCNRDDCSVPSSTWIPRGATLCRVERDYYDEFAPLLGE